MIALLWGLGACTPAHSQRVTVFAAASLRDAFTQIARENPQLHVQFSFEGSATLVDQLAQGAPADVFAAADTVTMARAVEDRTVLDPTTFTTNTLRLVVPRGNPAAITGLDASLEGKALVVCAARVPCGKASVRLAKAAGVTLKPVSEESKVSDVLGKVASGQADAGLVYASDAHSDAARVDVVAVAQAGQVVNDYPIAQVAGAPNPEGARAFIAAVTSTRGRQILAEHGFGR